MILDSFKSNKLIRVPGESFKWLSLKHERFLRNRWQLLYKSNISIIRPVPSLDKLDILES